MRRKWTTTLAVLTVAVGGGYYGLADALDLVPGPLTLAQSAQPAPYPTAALELSEPEVQGLSDDAPVPDAAALSQLADTLAADARVAPAQVGVSVIDVATGTELVDHNATTALTPASSNKLLVAWAMLTALGPDHRMTTRTVLDGDVLTLVAGGDVLMAADAGDATATVGHAGLGDLARATADRLKEQGRTSVTVRLDDTMFTGPTWNDAWEAGNESWVAPIQPLMIEISTHVTGTAYSTDPAMDAAKAFTSALAAAGVTVNGEVARAEAPDGADTLASVTSARLADVLAVSLKASDNTMTEVEARVLAAQTGYEPSFDGAAKAVLAQLDSVGIDTSAIVLRDGSGLAKANKVPARVLAQIIAAALAEDAGGAGRALIDALPVGALDGTLHDRLLGTSAAGRVRAKTGSLNQMASLSGTVVTVDGRQLAFAVLIDGFPSGGLWSARQALDADLISPLAQCGCQP